MDAAHVYVDEAISGAEYLKRPAYLRLMAALEPDPHFGALVVMEQSRLGRDTGRVLLAIQALEEAGVEIWSYQGGGSRISSTCSPSRIPGRCSACPRGSSDRSRGRHPAGRAARSSTARHW